MILRPRYLIAVSNGIKVRTCWNFNIHHLLSGRVRQFVFYGNGRLIVRGGSGLNLYDFQAEPATFKVEDGILVGYHVDSEYRLCRTEAFMSYLLRRTSLCDYQLRSGLFITQNQISRQDSAVAGNVLERFMGVLLNGIGKLLGF